MEPTVEAFGTQLATTAITKDWAGVHALLAPWLRNSLTVDQVRAFFEDDYREILAGVDIQELHYPEIPYVSGNSSSLEDLKKPVSWKPGTRPIASEVTEGNFRQWMTIQLQTSDAQMEALQCDFLTELWLIVVQLDEGLRVGYWSHDPY